MLRAKKKITKRELKEDPFFSTLGRAEAYYEENKKMISTVALVVIVIVVGILIYVKNRADNNEKASAQLAQVQQFYDNGQYQIAVDGVVERKIIGLKAIVENYGGTHAGNFARLYLAGSYFQLGNYAGALEEYKAMSGSEDLLAVARLEGIGACEEALGNHEDAASAFEKAAGYSDSPSVADNLGHAARNYGLSGERDRAIELYRKLKKNHSTSTAGREADRNITRLSLLSARAER